jgi:ABC-2 type transport system permease protein
MPPQDRTHLDPTRVVLARTARRAGRSGALFGLIFGVYVASSSVGFASTYPTAAARAKLATSFGTNAGLATLLGPARHIDTVAGFTSWRALAVLTIAGAVWALFLATRMLRGEEDSGRWELYLVGQTTKRGAAAQAATGLGCGLAALWAVTAVITIGVGRSSKVGFSVGGSLYLATCLVAGASMFLAIGALLSELAANRRQANGIGAAVLGAMYLIRMVADSTAGLEWLRWATPLGWIEELRPFVRPDPLALLPIAALSALAISVAVVVAGGRDLGASALGSRDTPPSHTGLLNSPLGLTIREARPVFIGWASGLLVFGLVIGVVANAAASAIDNSATVLKAINKLGAHGTGVRAYLGFIFVYVSVMVMFAAGGQVTAARAEEASTRLDNLLVRPVSRGRWLADRVGVAVGLIVGISLIGGLATWLGLAAQGGGASLPSLLEAGVNIVPPAVFVLGFGVLAYGVRPRVATYVAYAIVGWSFLVELVATVVTTNRLLLDTSLMSHITPAPAAHPNWVGDGWLVLLGVLAAGAGLICFVRRDLASE